MSLVNKLQSTDISPRTALFSIVVLVLATAGVLAVVMKLINAPASSRERNEANLPPVTGQPASVTARGPEKIVESSFSQPDYGVIVARNLFRPTETAVAVTASPSPLPIPGPAPATRSGSVPPLKLFVNNNPTTPPVEQPKLAYTGVVVIADETYALIEHLDTHEAQYVSKGGTAFECKVVEITPISVAIEYMGTPFTLKLGENKKEPEPTPPPAAQQGNQPPSDGQPSAGGPPGSGGPQPPNGGQFQGREGGRRFNRGNGENPGGNPAGGG